jgi:hypothetical protein
MGMVTMGIRRLRIPLWLRVFTIWNFP